MELRKKCGAASPGIDVSRDSWDPRVSGLSMWMLIPGRCAICVSECRNVGVRNDARELRLIETLSRLCGSAHLQLHSLRLFSLSSSFLDIITFRGAFPYYRIEVSSSYLIPVLYATFLRTYYVHRRTTTIRPVVYVGLID